MIWDDMTLSDATAMLYTIHLVRLQHLTPKFGVEFI